MKEEILGVRIPQEMKRTLRELAAADDRSLSSFVYLLLKASLENYQQLPLAGIDTQDEPTEESPAAQMKANGCKPLVEA